MITQEKWQKLRDKMQSLDIVEEDLSEKFILGSGRGGQNLQKTSSCVALKHLPTGIQIKCQQGRSREENRFYARRRLCEKIEELRFKGKSEKQQAIEKLRRQKRRRSRRAKQKILDDKSHKSQIKQTRKKPGVEE